MKIGELSSASATQVETIRYYEREGLLPTPERTEGNFRIYHAAHLERLQFIRHCRGLDMSLQEVRVLLRVKDDPSADCGDINSLLDTHIVHVAARIKELRVLEKQLRELRQTCESVQCADQCGILAGLSGAASAKATGKASRKSSHSRSVHARV